ncbi:MAG: methyltransferase domain-containing protein [Hyphomicrobiales bacterium]|nr:methyltransferase domain-containing protein [Hyphomicrobiales bacterium]
MNEMTDHFPPALFTFFEAMPRQGPGDDAVTAALFDRVRPLLPGPGERAIDAADMGCGSGAAALVLARKGARVTAVDPHGPFLDALAAAARKRRLGQRIATRRASMIDPGLEPESLDLVWSEGAVFTVGFDAALAEFRRLLRPGGVAVVSECSWLRRDPPEAAADFWADAYPGMRTVGGNLLACEAQGFRFLHAQVLPPEAWERNFHRPAEAVAERLRPGADPDMAAMIDEQTAEIALFRAHHEAYGYVFYVVQKPG